MCGSGDERDAPLRPPRPIDTRLDRDIRQEITVVKARAQLLRRLLRRGALRATDLDHGLAEIERSVDRLLLHLRRAEDSRNPPG